MDGWFSVALDERRGWSLDGSAPPEQHDNLSILWRGVIVDPGDRGTSDSSQPTRNAARRLANAYRICGPALIARLDGNFAAAILDHGTNRLTLVHDELGLSPIFCSGAGSRFVAATHLDRLPPVDRGELDEEYVADYLTHGWHLGCRTPFVGARRLAPGECLTTGPGALCRSLRAAAMLPQAVRLDRAQDYATACRDSIVRSVADLVPEATTLCELSGGLDSSTVYAAARKYNSRVLPFSFIYTQSHEADERPWIMASVGDTKWLSIDVDRHLPFTGELSEPLAEPSVELLHAARLTAFDRLCDDMSIDCVLTGIGGDTIFFGDRYPPDHLADALRQGRWIALVRDALAWGKAETEPRSLAFWLAKHALAPALDRWHGREIGAKREVASWLRRDYVVDMKLAQRSIAATSSRLPTIFEARWSEHLRRAAHAVAIRYQRRPGGPEYRHPLLARRLRAFMAGLPRALQIGPGADRLLQRHAIEGLVPDAVRFRRGKGGPDQAIYKGLRHSRHWQQKLTDDPEVVKRGYVDRDAWRTAVAQAVVGYTASIRLFQATASLEAWLQQRSRS